MDRTDDHACHALITRRRMLAASLAAAAGLALPGRTQADAGVADPNRFALLADTHICADPERIHAGVKPVEQFISVREEYTGVRPPSAALIVAGDCAITDGQPGDYATLARLVEPICRAGIPVHFALGNHDHRENFWQAFPREASSPVPGKHVTLIRSPHANWYVLDSLDKTNVVSGLLDRPQLDWLTRHLDAEPATPALILMHHYLETGKKSGLLDSDALLDAIRPRRQVKALFYGHSHRWSCDEQDGVHLVNIPTLVWLFDKTQPRGWVDAQLRQDGCRLVLNAMDREHPAHGQCVELAWR